MEAYRRIRAALDDEFARVDAVIGHWNVTVTAKADGTSELRRSRHMSEGSKLGIGMEMADPERPAEDARRFTGVVDRLLRRDRALSAAGHRLSRPPAWAHVADMTTTGILNRLGDQTDDLWTWKGSSNRMNGWDTGLVIGSFSDMQVMTANSFAARTRAHVDLISYDGVLWFGDGTGTPIVSITNQIPATIGVAAVGRPLDTLVDHPLTNGLGAVIADIEARDHLTLIRLETRLAPLASPPAGVDVSWLMPADGEPFGD